MSIFYLLFFQVKREKWEDEKHCLMELTSQVELTQLINRCFHFREFPFLSVINQKEKLKSEKDSSFFRDVPKVQMYTKVTKSCDLSD